MNDGIKQRLIGAVVLVALMVIFLPMFFSYNEIKTVDIAIEMPPKPSVREFDISKPQAPNQIQVDEQQTSQTQELEKPSAKSEAAPVLVSQPKLEAKQPDEKNLEELTDKKVDASNLPVSWTLQVASFKEQSNAEKLRDRLRQGGYKAYIKIRPDEKPQLVRVFVGPVLERKSIDDLKATINKQYKLDGLIVRYLP